MLSVYDKLSKQLEVSIEAMRKYYDKKRKSIESVKQGELVMLHGKNTRANTRCKKLEDKMFKPFEVIATGKNGLYCTLKLPESWKIHPMINIAWLE